MDSPNTTEQRSTVKRKRSTSPARNAQTQLPHFHELNSNSQRHHPSTRNEEIEPRLRSLHSRSHSTAYSDQEEHDIEAPVSPRQARSPYATSDLRGSPSTTTAPAARYQTQHYHPLANDLASITSPSQRASSTAVPQTPTTTARKMDAYPPARTADARDSASAEPSGGTPSTSFVKKEESTPGDKPRGGQACLECRLAKVRCLPSNESEHCQRCHRFNFECLFVQHKRGRKPKSKLQGRDLTLLAEAAYASNASPSQQSDRPKARKSASANSGIAIAPHPRSSSMANQGRSSASAASPGVHWSSAPDSAFPAPPYSGEYSDRTQGAEVDADTGSPSSAFFSKKQRLSALTPQGDTRAALDPKNLFGVDVTRMTQAMQQAMRSLERRRGAPYTLVTNNDMNSIEGNDDDANSDAGATPPAPGAATTADTNAANESFELIAEQPLTLRVMLKPFEVSDQPDCETPRILHDDRNPLACQPTQPQLNDPITQGILTEPAARALFDLFMHHCNAWSGVFDPSLHTHDFVRKRSSFLYTVLLYVGSRYSRRPAAHHLLVREQRQEHIPGSDWDIAFADPVGDRTPKAADEYARQIRRRIHEQAREHAARAFVDGDRTVLCCQAFFILASWKPLDDGLSVIQVGYAFRLAMDIQLHAEMPNCIKPNESNLDQAGQQRYEAVQRRFRNRQRTFLMLFVQDKSQQISNKITTHSISADNVLIRRAQTWWKHSGAIPTDAFVCASADIRRIQGKYVELYDRIEALSSANSDGPSVMMPAFLSDLYEWSARWHDALGLRENADDDNYLDDPTAYQRRCWRLCLDLWKNNIKTYVSSLVLKSSLKQAALQEHQEIVRNHHRRSTTRGTEDRDSVSGKSHLSSGLEPGMVNLMAMPAFWPCVEGARGVLETVCAFPPERLLSAPDATIMQTTHAAVLLCSLATVKSQPPLGPGYLRSNIQLIDQTSAAFRRASITEEDTVLHIAIYLESLLRPKNAVPTHSVQSHAAAGKVDAKDTLLKKSLAGGSAGTGGAHRTAQNAMFSNDSTAGLQSQNGTNQASGNPASLPGAAIAGAPGLGGGFSQFTNFTLLSNNNDMFYSGGGNTAPTANTTSGANARWFNGAPNTNSQAAQDGALFFNNGPGPFDREGLDAIASAAAAAAAAQNGEDGSMDMGAGVAWNSATMGNNGAGVAAPWNSLMFSSNSGTPMPSGAGEGYQQGQNGGGANVFQSQNSSREQADETLRMLLRFLDG